MLLWQIYAMKGDLVREFKRYDAGDTGNISVSNWCESMMSVTGLNLPWRTMRQKLVKGLSSDLTMVSHIEMSNNIEKRNHVKV